MSSKSPNNTSTNELQIKDAMGFLSGLMEDVEKYRAEAEGEHYETKTIRHDGTDDAENVCVLKNYKQISDIAVAGDVTVFGDNALTAIDAGEEFNSPSVGSPLVVRGVERFIVDSLTSHTAIIQAKNVYIKSVPLGKFCIFADNVFFGKGVGVGSSVTGLVVCKERFVYPFDGERHDVPFLQSSEAIEQIMVNQDHRSNSQKLADAKDSAKRSGNTGAATMLEFASLAGGIASAFSNMVPSQNQTSAPGALLSMLKGEANTSGIQVCSESSICPNNAGFVFTSANILKIYEMLSETFTQWTETKRIFSV